jgi:2-polyprenyl-3-methyl-5-hydroxy-6-metoxy-1,4-benzoquinol methylase
MKSLIYSNRHIYNLLMQLSYHTGYTDRLERVSELVENGAAVLDVCCGPCNLFPLLARKGVSYRGLDLNTTFVRDAQRRGIDAQTFDLLSENLPEGQFNYIILLSSLYQFIPHEKEIVSRLLAATKSYVIISEPIVNLIDRLPTILAKLVGKLKNPGNGPTPFCFTDTTLTQLMRGFEENQVKDFYIKGEKEKVYLLKKDVA